MAPKKRAAKKRADKYEEKLGVNLTFEQLVKVSVAPKRAPNTVVKKGK